MNWWKDLKGKVRQRELLKKHTTFKIGGPARFFIEPKDVDDLGLLLKLIKRYKISFFVIGRGSNLLVSDKGIDGVVLSLSSPYFKRVYFNRNCLEAGSGVRLSRVIHLAKEHGLSGVEFLAGIPGTVGGAIIMNAGAGDISIADVVENITIMDYNGKVKTLNKKKIKFSYRRSNLSKYIILSARLKLVKKDKADIKDKIKRYLDYRKKTQDLSRPSAGCIFKNPKRCSAAKLIDLCGLKGKNMGDAYISNKHANFILNRQDAKAHDVLRLMALVKRKVKTKFNLTLEPEIKIWQ